MTKERPPLVPPFETNKPGPAQVGAISKAQKWQKDFQVSIYSTRKSKNQKSVPSGAPGPANASPWRAKRGDTSEIVNIFVAVEGGTLWQKKISKKVSMPKNRKGGPFGLTRIVCYAGKQEKPFWFSSLGQMVQFGATIFCGSFKNYFGQFVCIEKKRKVTNGRVYAVPGLF